MMLLSEIAKNLNLKMRTIVAADHDVTSGYCSDLLSDVLKNCIAVASLLDLSAMVIVGGIDPDPNTVEKAVAENVALYTTDEPAFEIVGKLYELGVRGGNG